MNPKTIKEIIDDFNKRTNEFRKGGFETITIECVRGILSKSLLSLLDEVEKRLPEELEITGKDSLLDENFDFTQHDLKTNYNLAIQEVKKLLSDLREK